jgi:hypothetical protein
MWSGKPWLINPTIVLPTNQYFFFFIMAFLLILLILQNVINEGVGRRRMPELWLLNNKNAINEGIGRTA